MKGILVLFLSLISHSLLQSGQHQIIRGKVINLITQMPIADVKVKVKTAQFESISNAKGAFTLESSSARVILLFSHRMFFTREIEWVPGEELVVTLKPKSYFDQIEGEEDVNTIEEVIAIGHSSVKPGMHANARSSVGFMSFKRSTDPIYHHTEDYDFIRENTFQSVSLHPTSTFSIDVDKASYSNMRRFLINGQRPPKDAIRIEEMINYFHYDYPKPSREDPLKIYQELAPCPWNKEHKLLHIGLKAKSLDLEHLPASNLVFLIDVSGSMNTPNKLPLVKRSFELLLDQMRPHDRVAIVTYAGSSGIHLGSTPAGEKGEIRHAIQKLGASGSTAGSQGIETAYSLAKEHFIEGGNNRIILATDGDFNVGPSSDAELIRLIEKQRTSGIYLSILGFGMGNYKDNKMQKLAQHGNGNHHYIDRFTEAKKVFIHEFSGNLYSIADDVKLQLEFNPSMVAGYRLIGYENRLLQHEDFKNDKRDAGEIGVGHQVTALYEVIPAGSTSAFLVESEPLKYHTSMHHPSKDWLTIQVRYKNPGKTTSELLEEVVDTSTDEMTSDHFRWAAAVASFGMLLRDSEFKGSTDLNKIIALANSALAHDAYGYRAEFIQMMEGLRELAWMAK